MNPPVYKVRVAAVRLLAFSVVLAVIVICCSMAGWLFYIMTPGPAFGDVSDETSYCESLGRDCGASGFGFTTRQYLVHTPLELKRSFPLQVGLRHGAKGYTRIPHFVLMRRHDSLPSRTITSNVHPSDNWQRVVLRLKGHDYLLMVPGRSVVKTGSRNRISLRSTGEPLDVISSSPCRRPNLFKIMTFRYTDQCPPVPTIEQTAAWRELQHVGPARFLQNHIGSLRVSITSSKPGATPRTRRG